MTTLKSDKKIKQISKVAEEEKKDLKRKNYLDDDEEDYDDDDDNDANDDNDGDDNANNNEKPINKFANDGSFFELFKKMQEQQQTKQPKNDPPMIDSNKTDLNEKTKRKPKVLKVGIIKKKVPQQTSSIDESTDEANNRKTSSAWNHYMNEVRAYKEKYGDDEDKNRPLVK